MQNSNSVGNKHYEEQKILVQNLHKYLIALAASLEGRLSPAEEKILAKIVQVQVDLQLLLEDKNAQAQVEHENNIDRTAHAQAKKYAQDLVKAIRQKREHQQRLEITSQQLIRAEKLATVGQVAATIAHELGNIITPLLMYAKLIYEETVNDKSEVAEFADQIAKIAERAADMMRQLVDASRKEPARMKPLDVNYVIENSISLLLPQINKNRIEIQRTYPSDLPEITGRFDQLEQVFINLILNAVDAMPRGGIFSVEVELGYRKDDQMKEADFIVIRLGDTGLGISPEHKSQLFDPFFTTKSKGAGTGLGLFVTHLVINQHNGVIEVESEPGLGTTFIIKLPIAGQKLTETN